MQSKLFRNFGDGGGGISDVNLSLLRNLNALNVRRRTLIIHDKSVELQHSKTNVVFSNLRLALTKRRFYKELLSTTPTARKVKATAKLFYEKIVIILQMAFRQRKMHKHMALVAEQRQALLLDAAVRTIQNRYRYKMLKRKELNRRMNTKLYASSNSKTQRLGTGDGRKIATTSTTFSSSSSLFTPLPTSASASASPLGLGSRSSSRNAKKVTKKEEAADSKDFPANSASSKSKNGNSQGSDNSHTDDSNSNSNGNGIDNGSSNGRSWSGGSVSWDRFTLS